MKMEPTGCPKRQKTTNILSVVTTQRVDYLIYTADGARHLSLLGEAHQECIWGSEGIPPRIIINGT